MGRRLGRMLYGVCVVTALAALVACVGDDPTPLVVVADGGGGPDTGTANDGSSTVDAAPDGAVDGGQPPPCTAEVTGMIAWWTADGTFADRLGNHPLSTAVVGEGGGITFAAGKVDQAFDLQNAYLSRTLPDAGITMNALSVEGWMSSRTKGGAAVTGSSQGMVKWRIHYPAPDTLAFTVGSSTITTPAPAADSWVHVAGTWDGTTTHLFLDGVEVGTPQAFATPLPVSFFQLGYGIDTGPFSGLLDELTVYDRALSASEIEAMVAAGSSGRCK